MNPKKPQSPSFWNLFDEVKTETAASRSFFELLREPAEVERQSQQADTTLNCALEFNPQSVFWAMRNLPAVEATKHFLICGATGSGKSKTIELFLQSIAPRFFPQAPDSTQTAEQLILFDAKCDVIPLLADIGLYPGNNVWILNPYDARSAVWNFAEAGSDPRHGARPSPRS